MPKRFTGPEKWDDPWFWELSPQAKLLWFFLCDHCDNAGIIEVSFKLASSKIGLPVNENHLSELESRLHTLPCGKRIIIDFIRFQYGTVSRDCKPHNPVFTSLSKHGIDLPYVESLSKGLPKANQTPTEGLNNPTRQEKDKDKEGGSGGKDNGELFRRDQYHKDSRTVLHLLNEGCGKHFREVDKNLAFISARLYEPGVTLDGVRKMITRQCRLWMGTAQQEYLRPETLFNSQKFESYYASNELPISTNSKPGPVKVW